MRPTTEQLKDMSITQRGFDQMIRWGWVDGEGRAKRWYDHQRPNHDTQFEEPRERKAGKKKFVKEVR
jgi:hypothetical protein